MKGSVRAFMFCYGAAQPRHYYYRQHYHLYAARRRAMREVGIGRGYTFFTARFTTLFRCCLDIFRSIICFRYRYGFRHRHFRHTLLLCCAIDCH